MTGALVDRAAECAALGAVLAAVRDGLSGVLVLRGEAGIGKTALLEWAAGQAADMRVARVAAVESEMDLAFAGMHQLLVPFLGGLGALPVPQRQALEAAFGLADRPAPDRFLVGLATLTLITDAAGAGQPVLCVADDAQWLDRVSVEVLGFVARRLLADRVGMLFAVRTGEGEQHAVLAGLPELTLRGLPAEAAGEVLAAAASGPVDRQVGARLVAETTGNPLALAEFAGELSSDQLSGAVPLRGPLRFGGRLERLYQSRITDLPDETQRLLLVAAAEQLKDQAKIWRAARSLGIGPEAAEAPGAARLVVWEPRIEFRHPLIRSAAYYAAPVAVRRQAHAALAAATDPRADPDRRAWHLAEAAAGPDEEVAAALEESAARARARGGWASSAVSWQRAAELTPDPGRRARRLLQAAEDWLVAGEASVAGVLAGRAGPDLADPLARARARRVEGLTLYAAGQLTEAVPVLLEAARLLQPVEQRLALDTLLDAFAAAQLSGQSGAALGEVLNAAGSAAPPANSGVSVAGLLLGGFAAVAERRYEEGAALLRRAVAPLASEQPVPDEVLPHFVVIASAASLLYDDEARYRIQRRWVAELRDRGALAALLAALAIQMASQVQEGRFADAEVTVTEGRELSEATGYRAYLPTFAVTELLALAWQGRAAEVRPLAARLVGEFTAQGEGHAVRAAHHALAVLELGLGSYAEALDQARQAGSWQEPLGFGAAGELVEAAARTGDREVTAAAAAAFEPWALASGTHWALGLLARCRALLAGDSHAAEAEYQLALDHLRQTRIPPELARSHLVYGEWLRRQRRRRDAREQLRTAHDIFDELGLKAFADRARSELRATGEQAAERTPGAAGDRLTPQEAQIARLAGEGATNAEIAARLFISAATVEYHLRKVFRKLGVTSRVQLARLVVPGTDAPPAVST